VVRCAYDGAGRRFAVKMARRDRGADDIWLDLEAELIREILERNPDLHDVIVPVVDLATHEGRRALVMPWFDHRLDEAADLAAFPERLELAAEFALSVARLQVNPRGRPTRIVHRDIKPCNAFVERCEDGRRRVWLSDLGGAWRHDAVAGPSEHLYSSGYAPIDQQLARGGVDPTWDVYATAVSVFRVLTGHPLQAAADGWRHLTGWGEYAVQKGTLTEGRESWRQLVDVRRMSAMLREDVERLVSTVAEGAEDLPLGRRGQQQVTLHVVQELRAALKRALHPDPRRRPRDVGELAASLQQLHRRWVAQLQRTPQPPMSETVHRVVRTGGLVAYVLALGLLVGMLTGVLRYGFTRDVQVLVDGEPPTSHVRMRGCFSERTSADGHFEQVWPDFYWISIRNCGWWYWRESVDEGPGVQTIELSTPAHCRVGMKPPPVTPRRVKPPRARGVPVPSRR